MSSTTSQTGSVPGTGPTGLGCLDSDLAAININSGNGTQSSYKQTGINNTQYNAQTQTFYNTTIAKTEAEKIKACQDALLTIRPEDHRAALISAKGARAQGTCEWIKSDCEYQSLLRGDTRLLWIRGGPGKGKTMLSIFLTQDFERAHDVVYFFCQADDETRRSATYVLRSFIWQLTVHNSATTKDLIHYLYPPIEKQAALGSRESLWSIFLKMTSNPRLRTTFCVLDGLDECDDASRRWLGSKIASFSSMGEDVASAACLRMIIVSRPYPSAMMTSKGIILDPDHNDHISHDIEAFVDEKVEKLSDQLDNLPDESRIVFRSRMRRELLDRAEGTFLWVGFATIELLKASTWTEMEATIDQLPKGLPSLYDRMLLQIDPRHRPTSSKILRWIAFAAGPLSVDVLSTILKSKPSGPVPAKQITLDHLSMCGSLITISDHIVSLVHESVRDYLSLALPLRHSTLEEFHLQFFAVHLEMATTCLAYMEQHHKPHPVRGSVQGDMNQTGIDGSDIHQSYLLPSTPDTRARNLGEYAIRHWPEHARQSGNSIKQLIAASPSFFTKKSELRDRWWKLSRRYKKNYYDFSQFDSTPALHIACRLGISSWVAWLLSPKRGFLTRSHQNRTSGPKGLTPLMHATIEDHHTIVEQLLRNRAKVDAKHSNGKTALYYAVKHQRVAVVRLLVDHGANVVAEARKGFSVLHIAARDGNIVIMRQLLEQTTNVNLRSNGGRWQGLQTPLHLASSHVDMMRCLLDHDAEVDARDFLQQTPLHLAVRSGNTMGADLLLQRGATVDARSYTGRTPLHDAASNFDADKTLLALLLRAGADVNAQCRTGQTPLHMFASARTCWSSRSKVELLRVLLEAGATVDARCHAGQTPLHAAAGNSWVASVAISDVLLRAGADVNARSDTGETPLHAAAMNWKVNREFLELLLQADANVDAISADGRRPLHLAVSTLRGFSANRDPKRVAAMMTIVRVLVSYGSNFNIQGDFTLLHWAAQIGDEDLAKVLLGQGASSLLNAQDDAGRTPLHLAIIGWDTIRDNEDLASIPIASRPMFKGHNPESIARLLLHSGADYQVGDAIGQTALHYATKCEEKEIACILLELGADLDVEAADGMTALEVAKSKGNDALVQLLVNHRAREVESA